MGGKHSIQPKEEIICPKCPLTPIISLSLNNEGVLICEYRCQFMHFGHIPFEDITKDKENKHGEFCDRCKEKYQPNKEEIIQKQKNIIKEELAFCGTCKEFFCKNCRPIHNIEKETHLILVPKSKIKYTCLEHGETYIGYCFTCLISVCKSCKRHDKHCKKLFEDFYPEKDFSKNYDFYMGDYNNYIESLKKNKGMNKEHFNNFKKRNELLLNLCTKYIKL